MQFTTNPLLTSIPHADYTYIKVGGISRRKQKVSTVSTVA